MVDENADILTLAAEWHLLSAELRAAIMAIFRSSRKADRGTGAP